MKLIILVFLLLSSAVCDGIPEPLRMKLKHIKSFKELADAISIEYKSTGPGDSGSSSSKSKGENGYLSAASVGGGTGQEPDDDSHEQQHVKDEFDEHRCVFGSILQGSDTCSLLPLCVPIPIQNDNPLVVFYPRCYELMRCVGGCCESEESCHALTMTEVKKPLVEMTYQGHDRFKVTAVRNITMMEHTSCSCKNCALRTEQCAPGFVLGDSCECECANQADKAKCTGNFFWDASHCECLCDPTICSAQERINKDQCSCEPLKMDHIVASSKKAQDVDSLDIAQLSKLKALRRQKMMNQ